MFKLSLLLLGVGVYFAHGEVLDDCPPPPTEQFVNLIF